ncbi:indole-3-glycerol phosphate synthase TrpC [Acidiferrimicrobium sp. IK]|uniref:indole-3-glycerol phosphate synthase TrpC n=1 Tax=Acidiferrimicrobium sp. IK TaxID=2871700 RepID=UPI0021CB6692|nr:indole-3-glycerol phosphate synthase TrpC [Acidiferrimicrobium sp. IK]MCU4183615.1 indole-3-glycerol phosphate synthase TrpC [Acidiferrimicrobium sp. IK]
MPTYLDRILEGHRAAAALDTRPLAGLAEQAAAVPPARGFAAALRGEPGLSVIAEVKRRSPSKGPLAPDLDPAAVARDYQSGGAACLSVLTDVEWFAGSAQDLVAARAACRLPVLRKDFTVAPADVYDARIMGADAVLLIAAALSAAELSDLLALAGRLGMDSLVEVHDEDEAGVALDAGAELIGVNQRDLVTFEVDRARAARMAALLPDRVVRVAESGVGGPADAARLADAGFDAVLVGESVVTAADRAGAVRALRTPAGDRRSA